MGYEIAYTILVTATALLCFFAVIWCFSVLLEDAKSWKEIFYWVKTKIVTSVFTAISVASLLSITLVLLVPVEVTPGLFFRFLISRILILVVAALCIIGVTRLKGLESRMEKNVTRRFYEQHQKEKGL